MIYKSCPTPLGQKRKTGPLPLGREISDKDRIEKTINDLFEFGVPIEYLFDADDLLKKKDIAKVQVPCSVSKHFNEYSSSLKD